MAPVLGPVAVPDEDARPTTWPSVEALRAKVETLHHQRQQHLANAHACTGAIQFAEALIADLEGGPHG